MTDIPRLTPASERLASGSINISKPKKKKKKEDPDKAKYKIELMFDRKRSSKPEVANAVMILIWESGKRFHGGGDQKMYWCGYRDCSKPFSSDLFGYMHAVCPSCNREQFLDEVVKSQHINNAELENKNTTGLKNMPIVVGEKLARLTSKKLAKFLEDLWHDLGDNADIYLKYSPYELRYDPKFENAGTIDKLDKVRVSRTPLIYTLKAIRKDLVAGADLSARLVALITA